MTRGWLAVPGRRLGPAALAGAVPVALGYRASDRLGEMWYRRAPQQRASVRANLRNVLDGRTDAAAVHAATRDTFRHSARNFHVRSWCGDSRRVRRRPATLALAQLPVEHHRRAEAGLRHRAWESGSMQEQFVRRHSVTWAELARDDGTAATFRANVHWDGTANDRPTMGARR